MRKRDFLGSLLAAVAAPAVAQPKPATAQVGPVLLTVTGALAKPNRPPFDATSDLLMSKQGVSFKTAHAFTWADLVALPAKTIAPTLEYDGKPHRLRGPLLTEVLQLAGARATDATELTLRAIDGYAPSFTWREARAHAFIVATHRDDQPLALGGLGPLWAMFDADRFADVAAKPLAQRFANCPWGLYHIEVAA